MKETYLQDVIKTTLIYLLKYGININDEQFMMFEKYPRECEVIITDYLKQLTFESITKEIESDGVDGLVTNTKENIYVENENIYADNNQPTKKQKGLSLMDAVENHTNNEDVNIYADDSDDNIYYSSEDDLNTISYSDNNEDDDEEFEI